MDKENVSVSATKASIRFYAMGLLARREHAKAELIKKLENKFPESLGLIDGVVANLHREKLQCDERFTEAFISYRVKKGQGPQRIAQELQQRGIEKSLAQAALVNCGYDWYQLARNVFQKKYHGQWPDDVRAQAKCRRFLYYRGFDSEQIASCCR